ncbi:hypothetical protein [Flammeovirga sp. SJP92]|uniref:hypothetical protein n=1 Tax=Flammeovirga sp. SJP92 TaxID=1775430 RepID=UPI0007869A61|nr:hypothetical protein [Flammeovirga sp. SJP92]KXX66489.1 hypothetical protein AVL50_31680 [Flammeovirga sp. SJP92]
MDLDKTIISFLEEKIINYEITILPHSYPQNNEKGFLTFQAGYRYNSVTMESLVGTIWDEDLYVICSNYYSDPFVFNIQEKDKGYPIYYCEHGGGKWNFRKVFDSIETFKEFIMALPKYDIEEEDVNYNELLAFLNNYHLKNDFIVECIEEVKESIRFENEEL